MTWIFRLALCLAHIGATFAWILLFLMPSALDASADTTVECKTVSCKNEAEKKSNYGFCAACRTPGVGSNRFTCRSGKCECATCKNNKKAASTRRGSSANASDVGERERAAIASGSANNIPIHVVGGSPADARRMHARCCNEFRNVVALRSGRRRSSCQLVLDLDYEVKCGYHDVHVPGNPAMAWSACSQRCICYRTRWAKTAASSSMICSLALPCNCARCRHD